MKSICICYKMIDHGKSVIKEWKEDETIFDLINESVMEIEIKKLKNKQKEKKKFLPRESQ